MKKKGEKSKKEKNNNFFDNQKIPFGKRALRRFRSLIDLSYSSINMNGKGRLGGKKGIVPKNPSRRAE